MSSLDRDSLYTSELRRLIESARVKPVSLPPRSPNLNAFAERFVLSIKSEFLDRIVPMGEGHLRKAVAQFVEHYPSRTESPSSRKPSLPSLPSRRRSGSSTRTRPPSFFRSRRFSSLRYAIERS
jgi:putative transposase